MNDVAREADVSQTCVSMVLSGKGNIPEETQKKVLEACTKLGYRKNRIAVSLNRHQGGTGIIGLVADNLLGNDFAHEIIAGCQAGCRELDKTLMIATVNGLDSERDAASVQTLLDFQVESLVYATHFYRSVTLPSILLDKPVCLINCYTEDRSVATVIPDDYNGAYKATEYLIGNGHRNILFLSNSLTIGGKLLPATIKREKAFTDVASKYGLEAVIERTEIERKALLSLIEKVLSSSSHPSAIFTYNDRMALTVISKAKDMGIRVPEDLSVIGYDNQEVISRFITPSLTTVALPHFDMGYKAIMHVDDHHTDKEREILAEPLLVAGESVARI